MIQETKRINRTHKSLFKRIVFWLHLWLGIISGLIVFIISITGCIYVFEKDIRNVTQKYQFVEPEQKPFLPPSHLKSIARQHAFGNKPDTGENRITGIVYGDAAKATYAYYTTKGKGFTMVYMNPYSGKVLKEKILEEDFFRIILAGHFYLWLPHDIGQPVVASAVLIFVVLLITGIIMWWPKNLKKGHKDKSFKIKWKARFKRLNYDLHNVLGFYVSLVALVIALTGLVWGFKWYAKGLYWVTSGGKKMPEAKKLTSDTTRIIAYKTEFFEDRLFQQMQQDYKDSKGYLQMTFPQNATDVFAVTHNPEDDTYYKREFRRFDRYTLQELKLTGVFAKKFEEAAFADKLSRMNYDIHVGAILGWPGKILAFFASLICASLPITGFLVWWGKRKKKKLPHPAKAANLVQTEFVS